MIVNWIPKNKLLVNHNNWQNKEYCKYIFIFIFAWKENTSFLTMYVFR